MLRVPTLVSQIRVGQLALAAVDQDARIVIQAGLNWLLEVGLIAAHDHRTEWKHQ